MELSYPEILDVDDLVQGGLEHAELTIFRGKPVKGKGNNRAVALVGVATDEMEPGDVIATGTPEGVGMATGDFLRAGDKIECKIENLGTLTNRLAKQPTEFYKPLN